MKNLLLFMLLVWLLVFASVQVFAGRGDELPDSPLRDVNIRRSNLLLALSDLAESHNIPIGVEISPKDDLLKDHKIVVSLKTATLREVLNALINQNPLYTWSIQDGVVNVFPRTDRDPLLKTLLETRIATFKVPPRTGRFTFRESITQTSEIERLLARFQVKAENESFLSRDIALLGHDFSTDFADATVRTILNRVIRDSGTKYWIVSRYGRSREFLLLNL